MQKTIRPNKQRKYKATMPLHQRKRLFHVRLSKELQQKYNRRHVTIRPGDKVKVVRGQFRKSEGKVSQVDRYNERVYIESVERVKKDGTKVPYPIHPTNLVATTLDLQDKKRQVEKK